MDDATIKVTGIVDLQRALRELDKDLPKELAAGLGEAAEIVLDAARPLVPRRTGKAAGSMKVKKQQRGAALAVGGTAAPYFPWLDFGGKVGRNRSVTRPFISGGRYIYPTLKAKDEQVKAKVDEVLERMAKAAGFDTGGDAAK